MSYCETKLLGNMCQDIELKQTNNGQSYVMFSVATNYSFKRKDSDEWEKETTFHNCIAYGAKAESIARQGGKGKQVFINGRLKSAEVEKNGMKVVYWSIVVDTFICLTKPERVELTPEEADEFINDTPKIKRTPLQQEEVDLSAPF